MFTWRVFSHFERLILVVDVVANADELLVEIGAGDEHDCYADDFRRGNSSWLRAGNVEHELVGARSDWTGRELVEFLIHRVAQRGANVNDFPIQIFCQIFMTLETYLELEAIADLAVFLVRNFDLLDKHSGHVAVRIKSVWKKIWRKSNDSKLSDV